jgi:hypothetical protein
MIKAPVILTHPLAWGRLGCLRLGGVRLGGVRWLTWLVGHDCSTKIATRRGKITLACVFYMPLSGTFSLVAMRTIGFKATLHLDENFMKA